jgi:hydrogenase maturation factor
MTDRRGVVAQRAETLTPGVPYVRGWTSARRGAETLASQLTALGLASDFPGLSADVNVFGDGLVRLGTIRPEAALLLAALIASGLAAELSDDTEQVTPHREPSAA